MDTFASLFSLLPITRWVRVDRLPVVGGSAFGGTRPEGNPRPGSAVRTRRDYADTGEGGISSTLPVVRRPSKARCASAT